MSHTWCLIYEPSYGSSVESETEKEYILSTEGDIIVVVLGNYRMNSTNVRLSVSTSY